MLQLYADKAYDNSAFTFIINQKVKQMNDILGKDNYSFEPIPDWANLPPEVELGDVAGIAVDEKDRVYLFNRGNGTLRRTS